MRTKTAILCALGAIGAAATAAPVQAQQQQRRIPVCIDVANAPRLTFTGRLGAVTARTEDMAFGPERIVVLELERRICVRDDGQFADPFVRFTSIQVYANSPALRAALRRHIGRDVTVEGTGFPAQTAHHYRPLVLAVDRVRPAPGR